MSKLFHRSAGGSLRVQLGLFATAIVVGVLLSTGGLLSAVVAVSLGLSPVLISSIVGLSVRTWMVVLVTATCINGIRVPLGGFNLLPEHFIVCGVLLVLAMRMPTALFRTPSAFELLLLLWVVWNGVVSVLLAPEPQRSLPIVAWLLLSWTIMWAVRGYLLHAEPDDGDHIRRTLLGVGAVAGFIAFALWVVALGGISVPGVQPEPYTRTVAARGLSYEANILGSQLLFVVIAGLVVMRSLHRRVPPLIWVGLAVGILSTMTRAVWVAAIVVGGLEWLRSRNRESPIATSSIATSKPAWMLVLAFALLPFFFLSASNPVVARFRGSLDFASGTAQLRLGGVQEALRDMNGSALITGLGTNTFGQRHRNVVFADERGYLSVLPLVVLYDTGLIGGILMLAACAALSLRHAASVDRRYAHVFLLALLITGSATNPIWFGITWVLVAIVGTPPIEASAHARSIPAEAV